MALFGTFSYFYRGLKWVNFKYHNIDEFSENLQIIGKGRKLYKSEKMGIFAYF